MWWLILGACTAVEPAYDGVGHLSALPEQISDGGRYIVYWRALRSPLPYGVSTDVRVRLTDASAPTWPVDGAAVRWRSLAPDGVLSQELVADGVGDGEYVVADMQVDRVGWWTFEVHVEGGLGADGVSFDFPCCGGGDTD